MPYNPAGRGSFHQRGCLRALSPSTEQPHAGSRLGWHPEPSAGFRQRLGGRKGDGQSQAFGTALKTSRFIFGGRTFWALPCSRSEARWSRERAPDRGTFFKSASPWLVVPIKKRQATLMRLCAVDTDQKTTAAEGAAARLGGQSTRDIAAGQSRKSRHALALARRARPTRCPLTDPDAA
jgi:hypothetical protein